MPVVMVTGGAGFIGSHLTEALLARGDRVAVVDSFDDFYDPEVKRANLALVADRPDFRLYEGDIRDAGFMGDVFGRERPAVVVHLAARAGVRPSIEQPELYASVNLGGTACLLERCREHSVTKLVFGSSSSVYGNNRKVPFSETDAVDRPISPYAATKKAGEVMCHAHHHLFGIAVACLRFFTVYGPRQRPEMAIHKFTRRVAEGRPIQLYGDGSSARDYTFVDDIVDGILRAIDRCAGYEIWNLGGSQTTRLDDLVRMIGESVGREPRIERLPMQPGDVERTWADVARARAELGWEPRVPLREGLERFASWYLERRSGER